MTDARDDRDLPDGWVWTTFSEVADHRLGKMLDKRKNVGTPRPYLRNINVRWHGFDLSDVLEMRIEDHELAKYTVRKGDLVICEGGEPGRAAIWKREEPFAYQKALHRARTRDGIETEYLLYMLEEAAGSGRLAKHFTGSTINHLTGRELAKVRVPLSPLAEQRRIVDALEAHFADLDAGVAALEAARRQLERYRRSVLKAAVEGALTSSWRAAHPNTEPARALLDRILEERRDRWEAEQLRKYEAKGKTPPSGWRSRYTPPAAPETDGLAELPEGWVWASVDQISEVVTGSTPSTKKPEFYSGPHPFYKPSDLDAGENTRDAVATLTEEGLREARTAPRRSTLVTCIGATIGKTGFIHREGGFNQQINAAIPFPSVHPRYLYLSCVSPQFQNSIHTNASATTLPILNKSRFSALTLSLPSIEEQAAIVEQVDERLSVAEAVAAEIDRQLVRAARLRRSLLQEAFAGRLVPQDPADEPASALLARIRGLELAEEGAPGTQTALDFG